MSSICAHIVLHYLQTRRILATLINQSMLGLADKRKGSSLSTTILIHTIHKKLCLFIGLRVCLTSQAGTKCDDKGAPKHQHIHLGFRNINALQSVEELVGQMQKSSKVQKLNSTPQYLQTKVMKQQSWKG